MDLNKFMVDLIVSIKDWIKPALDDIDKKINNVSEGIVNKFSVDVDEIRSQLVVLDNRAAIDDLSIKFESMMNDLKSYQTLDHSTEQAGEIVALREQIEGKYTDIDHKLDAIVTDYESLKAENAEIKDIPDMVVNYIKGLNLDAEFHKYVENKTDSIQKEYDAKLLELTNQIEADKTEVKALVSSQSDEINSDIDVKLTSFNDAIESNLIGYMKTIDYQVAQEEHVLELEKCMNAEIDKIPTPKDGKDGLDAVSINILPDIDLDKSYNRGTFATHNGGLWWSHAKTNGLRGWDCIVSGFPSYEVNQVDDREVQIVVSETTGEVKTKTLSLPTLIYRGVWKEQKYSKGDTVTWAGSLWHCNKDTEMKPGENNRDWQLAVKRGRDAK